MTKMNYDRLYILWQAARMSPDHMPIVEVGVYRGGSAKFIAETRKGFFGIDPESNYTRSLKFQDNRSIRN